METISNIASTATNTVSSLIYGDQTKKNETAGTEPVSGKEGKGTVTEPYDQGNAPTPAADDKKTFLDYSKTGKEGEDATTSTSQKEFLQLSPEVDASKPATQASTITSKDETTSTGLPIIPLTPDAATSGPTSTSKDATETTGPTGTTDKVWKDTPLDDISRSGAPGAGPAAPEFVTVATPETTDKSATPETTDKSATPETTDKSATATAADKTTTTTSTSTSDPLARSIVPKPATTTSDTHKDTPAKDSSVTSGIVGEKPHHKSEPTVSSPSSEEKTGKITHLKEKLKDKLHIGSKDK